MVVFLILISMRVQDFQSLKRQHGMGEMRKVTLNKGPEEGLGMSITVREACFFITSLLSLPPSSSGLSLLSLCLLLFPFIFLIASNFNSMKTLTLSVHIGLHIVSYNTTLLRNDNTVTQGMFSSAKYTHHTFTPIIKTLLNYNSSKQTSIWCFHNPSNSG